MTRTPGRQTSPLATEERESWRSRNLRRAIQLGDGGGIALRLLLQARSRLERVRRDHSGAGGLVIARDINHARRIGALLEEEGDRVHLVHCQDPEAASHLAAFQAGQADWLVSVDMCAEGFDAPRLRVVAYLTTVVTRSRFVQAITRTVRIDAERATGKRSRATLLRLRPGRPPVDRPCPHLVPERALPDPVHARGQLSRGQRDPPAAICGCPSRPWATLPDRCSA